MKIVVIGVGKIKEKYIKDGIAEYSKRLSRFCDLEIIEVDDEPIPENLSPSMKIGVMKKEADRIAKYLSQKTSKKGMGLKTGSVIVALDVKGEKHSSESFASKMGLFFASGISNIIFIIGGSLGLDKELLESAQLRLSLSELTFPHQLVRLILLEQIYRAFKINNGEP